MAEPQLEDQSEEVAVAEALGALNDDPFLYVDQKLNLISVFDDLKYDRSDLDTLSAPMRRRVVVRLEPLGFRQMSGGLIENPKANIRVLLPKLRALGASPFDVTRDTPRRAQDFYVLTPTQTACQWIDAYSTDDAVEAIKTLVVKHPINLLRIADFLERTERHRAFLGAIGHLKYVQRIAVS
ncbi:MAG: hypothetical protein HRU32_16520, partial [Rhodobacteraceae bacterium]|nr:hypothetical protein [Paracoccaceae bacterium]